jgi:hypothetical protein
MAALFLFWLVVIDDPDVGGTARRPAKNDSPLSVDPDAVKASEVAFECFQPITRWGSQIVEVRRGIEDIELARPHGQNLRG